MRKYKKFFKKWYVVVVKYKFNYKKYKRHMTTRDLALTVCALLVASVIYERYVENHETE